MSSFETPQLVEVSKAWDMAHAAKDLRDYSAYYRLHEDKQRSAKPSDELPQLVGVSLELDYDLDICGTDFGGGWLDSVADDIEHVAGLIHDHPFSESYMASVEKTGFELTPLNLALNGMSYLHAAQKEALGDIEGGLEQLPAKEVLSGIKENGIPGKIGIESERYVGVVYDEDGHLSLESLLGQAYGTRPKGLEVNTPGTITLLTDEASSEHAYVQWRNYDKLIKEPNTTVDQIRELYIQAFKDAYISEARQKMAIAEHVINDIQNGNN